MLRLRAPLPDAGVYARERSDRCADGQVQMRRLSPADQERIPLSLRSLHRRLPRRRGQEALGRIGGQCGRNRALPEFRLEERGGVNGQQKLQIFSKKDLTGIGC